MSRKQWAAVLAVFVVTFTTIVAFDSLTAKASQPQTVTLDSLTVQSVEQKTVWLSYGDSSSQVTELQQYLADNGWSLDVDGQYGKVTTEIVTQLQRMSGLHPDGIVGPITWAATVGTNNPVVRGNQTQANPLPPQPVQTPTESDCASWKPLLDKYGMPYELFQPIMQRESRCTNAHNYNPRTRDDSYGPLQVNRYGSLDAGWNSVGISRSYMATPEGAVHAASMLYHSCESLGPWTKPYSCKKWLF